jgi:hypothetical protein
VIFASSISESRRALLPRFRPGLSPGRAQGARGREPAPNVARRCELKIVVSQGLRGRILVWLGLPDHPGLPQHGRGHCFAPSSSRWSRGAGSGRGVGTITRVRVHRPWRSIQGDSGRNSYPFGSVSARAFRSGSHGLGAVISQTLEVCACLSQESGGTEHVDDDAGRSRFGAGFDERLSREAKPLGERTTPRLPVYGPPRVTEWNDQHTISGGSS